MNFKNVNKTFVFHRERYITESLAKALGYSDDSYSLFHKPDDLIACIKESPTLLLLSGDSPVDLKHILNEVFGRRANNTHLIIFATANSSSLTKRLSGNRDFPEFETCLKDGLLDVISLPEDIKEIGNKINAVSKSYVDDHVIKKSQRIREKVSIRLSRKQDEDQRHRMGNLEAASRIFNGAINSGDYDLLNPNVEENLTSLYRKLIFESKEGWDENQKWQRWKDTLNVIIEAKNKLEACNTNQRTIAKPWHQEKDIQKILVIDDQKEMWEPVWKFILGGGKVDFVESSENGLERVYDEKSSGEKENRYDLVILDVHFGEGKKNGLEILQEIKQRQFDLPVIMTTACDHAELTKRCLRMGAHSYFVKELEEDARDSVAYYKKLRDMIKEITPYNSREREIWRNFVQIEDKINAIDKKHGTQIGHCFRKSYYLFTMDEDQLIATKLLIPEWIDKSTIYDGVAFNAINTTDQLFIAVLITKENKIEYGYSEARGELFESERDSTGKKSFPSLKKRMQRAGIKCNLSALNNAGSRHAFRTGNVNEIPTGKGDANKCMDALIDLLNIGIGEITISINENGTNTNDTNNNIRDKYKQLLETKKENLGHEDRSIKSAKCLSDGFREWRRDNNNVGVAAGTNGRVLFVDDEGGKSAWYLPLKEIFTFQGFELECKEKVPEGIKLNDYKLILLDLMFKEGEGQNILTPVGLDNLKTIKEGDSGHNGDLSIPVVMLTADNSAFYARRCLLHGADDYFVKEPYAEALKYYEEFSDAIDRHLKQGDINSLRRDLWSKVENIKDYDFGLDIANTDDVRWERIEKFKNVKTKHLRDKSDKKNAYLALIQKLTRHPLREAYFYYLLMNYEEMFVDLWRVKRLLSTENCEVDIILCLGQLVEYLMMQLYEIQEDKSAKDEKAGHLINTLNYSRKLGIIFEKVWELRKNAKTGKNISAVNINDVFNELIVALKELRFYKESYNEIYDSIAINSIVKVTVLRIVLGKVRVKITGKQGIHAYIPGRMIDDIYRIKEADTFKAKVVGKSGNEVILSEKDVSGPKKKEISNHNIKTLWGVPIKGKITKE